MFTTVQTSAIAQSLAKKTASFLLGIAWVRNTISGVSYRLLSSAELSFLHSPTRHIFIRRLFFCTCFLTLAEAPLSSADEAPTIITLPAIENITNEQDQYFIDLLHLVLKATEEEFGPYEIQYLNSTIPQTRAVLMLQSNHRINLLWTMTSKQRETNLKAIRRPLLNGLFGLRIFIINREDQPTFNKIRSLDQLKKLKAGQGRYWPDTKILKTNGLKVVESPSYQSLFSMLKARRFDYFPRGVSEPWGELSHLNDPELVVEKRLLLRYQAPVYFFVNQSNDALYRRLDTGLSHINKNGKHQSLFMAQAFIQHILDKADLKNRVIFDLNNPDISPPKTAENLQFWQ